MTRRTRMTLFAPGAGGLALLLGWGLAGLPDFGHYPGPLGDLAKQLLPSERNVASVPAGIVFDLRGFDTVGEEMILFAAVTGVALVLRERGRDGGRREEERVEDDELRLLGLTLVPPTLLLGIYLAVFGHISPGGGFQAGLVLASAFALLYLGAGSHALDRLGQHHAAEGGEGLGAGGFVAIGLLGLAIGGTFLENVLPNGTTSHILSAGTIPLLNVIVAVAVAAAFVILVHEFLAELLIERGRDT
jgi:multicomponent Na+:H+ antiporter subunit B